MLRLKRQTVSRTLALFVFFWFSFGIVSAREYETQDAVVIEADEEETQPSSRTARQWGTGGILWPGGLPVGPCYTSQGVLGRCTSFRQCYPYFKLPELTSYDAWVLGMYDTCSYFSPAGRQVFGVCCGTPAGAPSTLRPFQPRPEAPTEAPIPVTPETPASWPPALPTHKYPQTHPPIPTHPTVGPPATTTTTTTRPPGTTRPPYPFATESTTKPTPYPTYPTQAPAPAPTPPPPPPSGGSPGTDAQCGLRNGDANRITGGGAADKNEWPWIAGLFNNGRQFCGGSLIDPTHILTAAHCVAHMTARDVARLTVRLGDHNIHSSAETTRVVRRVKRVVRHRGFNGRTLYNDVALLTMDSPVTYSTAIRPVCLPSGGQTYAGEKATVVGWGSLRENGPQPSVLQEVEVQIWKHSDCRATYGSAAPGGIVEHMLCAGQLGKDSCSGDSGGPLSVQQSKNRWTQVGVVSWGIGCGKSQYPGVYTRVTQFMNWIQTNSKN